MQAVLDQHNVYRCMHGVPPFTWDDAAAANAQAWADNGYWGHSSGASRMLSGEQFGENLAWGSPTWTGAKSTVSWYSEIQYTSPYGTADSFTDTTVPGQAIGHYTQVVWSTSVKLGCGKGRSVIGGNEGDYWVCQYGPSGNYAGQFTTKVKAPVKTAEECGGSASDVPGGGSGVSTTAGGSGVTTTAGATTSTRLPSSCTPSPLLPHGALCAYGYQCQSSFCCPRLRVCLTSSSASVSSNDIKVKDGMKNEVLSIIFNGGTCQPFSNTKACLQSSSGQPLKTWDQEACGCKEEYMVRYRAGTWVTLNDIDGLVCEGDEATTTGATTAGPSSGGRDTTSNATTRAPIDAPQDATSGAAALRPLLPLLFGAGAALAC